MPPPRPPPTNEEIQEEFLGKILRNNKGIPNAEKTGMIFSKMLDGKSHAKKDLVKLVDYAGTDNKAFRNLMACIEKDGFD
jgi:uncharacterized GH25 family protein